MKTLRVAIYKNVNKMAAARPLWSFFGDWKQILVFELGYDLTLISCMKKRCCDKETSRWPILFLSASNSRPILIEKQKWAIFPSLFQSSNSNYFNHLFAFLDKSPKLTSTDLIRTSKFKCSFRWRCHISFKFRLEYCKYSMSLVIFKRSMCFRRGSTVPYIHSHKTSAYSL
jgi:hypothetical protein